MSSSSSRNKRVIAVDQEVIDLTQDDPSPVSDSEYDAVPRRKSRRVTISVGWVDSHKLSSIDEVVEDLLSSEKEWNLFVCQEEDSRHCFVVHKSLASKRYFFYDYQGRYFVRDRNFSTTNVMTKLRKRSGQSKVLFGQKNEIFGDDNAHLCMKNSSYVMKYKRAPLDCHFKDAWPGDSKAPARLTRACPAKLSDGEDYAERKVVFEQWRKPISIEA